MTTSWINPDLKKERSQATFDKEELSLIIYHGPTELQKKRQLGKIVK